MKLCGCRVRFQIGLISVGSELPESVRVRAETFQSEAIAGTLNLSCTAVAFLLEVAVALATTVYIALAFVSFPTVLLTRETPLQASTHSQLLGMRLVSTPPAP